jgi:hypothetical protein
MDIFQWFDENWQYVVVFIWGFAIGQLVNL